MTPGKTLHALAALGVACVTVAAAITGLGAAAAFASGGVQSARALRDETAALRRRLEARYVETDAALARIGAERAHLRVVRSAAASKARLVAACKTLSARAACVVEEAPLTARRSDFRVTVSLPGPVGRSWAQIKAVIAPPVRIAALTLKGGDTAASGALMVTLSLIAARSPAETAAAEGDAVVAEGSADAR